MCVYLYDCAVLRNGAVFAIIYLAVFFGGQFLPNSAKTKQIYNTIPNRLDQSLTIIWANENATCFKIEINVFGSNLLRDYLYYSEFV